MSPLWLESAVFLPFCMQNAGLCSLLHLLSWPVLGVVGSQSGIGLVNFLAPVHQLTPLWLWSEEAPEQRRGLIRLSWKVVSVGQVPSGFCLVLIL